MRELAELVHAALPELELEEASFAVRVFGFTLEDGAAQLARHFSEVRRVLYEDALRVTEAEPLLAYVLSGPLSKRLSTEQIARLREATTRRITERGYVHVTKASGIFMARGH